MDKQQITKIIADNLESARILIEQALNLGQQHGIPVDLTRTGVARNDDVWYTDPLEKLEEMKEEYGEDSEEYLSFKQRVEEGDPFDDYGYKQWGWMSSSTNC